MSYVDAVSNAIAARGNALSQGALQSGQVWGNLAANLGQIPGQAIAYHQQRQDALQNSELKKLTIEKAQRTAGMEKEMIRIVNSGLPDDQIIAELERVGSADPDVFLKIQNLKSQFFARQQQALHQQKMEEAQNLQGQISFHKAQEGGPGVLTSMPTPTGPNVLGNALSPIIPQAQPNIPGVRINPSLQTKYGTLPGGPTGEEQLVRKREESDINLEKQKELLRYGDELRGDKPPTAAGTEIVEVPPGSGKFKTMQWNPEHQRYDIEVGTPRPQPTAASLQIYRNEDIPSWADALARGEVAMTEIPAPIRGKVMAMARAKGNAIVPKKVREQITALNSAKNLVTPLRTMLQDIVSAKDPAERTRASLILKNYGESISGRIARSFGEVGTMNEGDIKRATGLVPGIIAANFDPAFATRELDWLDTILKNQEDNFKRQSFSTVPINPSDGAAPAAGGGGLDPQKKARLEELRAKKAAGTLGK